MVTNNLRGSEELGNLPRKINIGLSTSRDDFAHCHINDVGLKVGFCFPASYWRLCLVTSSSWVCGGHPVSTATPTQSAHQPATHPPTHVPTHPRTHPPTHAPDLPPPPPPPTCRL